MSNHVTTYSTIHHTSPPIESLVYVPTCPPVYLRFVTSDYLSTYQCTSCLPPTCLPSYLRTLPGILLPTYPSIRSLVGAATHLPSYMNAHIACVLTHLLIHLPFHLLISSFPSRVPTYLLIYLKSYTRKQLAPSFLAYLSIPV